MNIIVKLKMNLLHSESKNETVDTPTYCNYQLVIFGKNNCILR